jgi:hypothetical protein
MTIERAPDVAAGVSVFTTITAQFMADPLQTLATVVAILAAIFSILANLERIASRVCKWFRK